MARFYASQKQISKPVSSLTAPVTSQLQLFHRLLSDQKNRLTSVVHYNQYNSLIRNDEWSSLPLHQSQSNDIREDEINLLPTRTRTDTSEFIDCTGKKRFYAVRQR